MLAVICWLQLHRANFSRAQQASRQLSVRSKGGLSRCSKDLCPKDCKSQIPVCLGWFSEETLGIHIGNDKTCLESLGQGSEGGKEEQGRDTVR